MSSSLLFVKKTYVKRLAFLDLKFFQDHCLVVGHRGVGVDGSNRQVQGRSESPGVVIANLLPIVTQIASRGMGPEAAFVIFEKYALRVPSERYTDFEIVAPRTLLARPILTLAA